MEERMKMVLERTKNTLCRNLENLNDAVDENGGDIPNHAMTDEIKDSLKGLHIADTLLKGVSASATVAAGQPFVR